MAQASVRLYLDRRDGTTDDMGLFELQIAVEQYDTLTSAWALQQLKKRAELGYSIHDGVLEFVGALIPLTELRALRCEIVSIDRALDLLQREADYVRGQIADGNETFELASLAHALDGEGSVTIAGVKLEHVKGDTWRVVDGDS